MDSEKSQAPKGLPELIQQLFADAKKPNELSVSESRKTLPPLGRTHKVFQVMNATYLQKWTSQITPDLYDVAVSQWNAALQDMHDDFVKDALRECAVKFQWPPSIKEFRELCLMHRDQFLDRKKFGERPRRLQRTPEQLERDRRAARDGLNKVWATLGRHDQIRGF